MPMIKENVFATWTPNTKEYYKGMGFEFTKFGDEFEIDSYSLLPKSTVSVNIKCDFCHKITSKKRKNIRNPELICCNDNCRKSMDRKRTTFICPVCSIPFERNDTQIKKNINKIFFCSTNCSVIGFKKEKDMSKYALNQCEYCEKDYEYLISNYVRYKPRFCSVPCRNKWESVNKRGSNHHMYNSIFIQCDYCKNDILRCLSRILLSENQFCNTKCRRKWYSEVWSKTEEWKLESAERAVRMLSDGTFGKTDTAPQKIVNNILNEMKVGFINEYNCKYYSIDNFLTEHELMIEVMGTYWHADHRIYSLIEYQNQHDRIIHDKRKHSYIKRNFNTEVLYLWEQDIINNPELCKAIIKLFIDNKGVLKNYHSFNYDLSEENTSLIIEKLDTPYFSYSKEKLSSLIQIKDKSMIVSHKQEDKWITFKCEQCNKESEQLKVRYNAKKHHFCSTDCHHEFKRGKTWSDLRKCN